ncbi:hypothetical protein I317_02916 [Kwoniella heveanensis CBS 569]|nr:hypothetical protein I317_02916 [Kwoniella heveanensis CBS 569]
MAESGKTKVLSEADVEAKIIKLKAAEPDKKVDILQLFGLELEDAAGLPEPAIDPLTLLVPPLIRSSHPLLQSSTLTSFLPFFIPLIPLSPTSHLRLALLQILPALLEKLNDPKDRIHTSAANALYLLGARCFAAEPSNPPSSTSAAGSTSSSSKGKEKETLPQTWERSLKDTMMGKAWRSKVEAMKVLIRIRAELGAKVGLKMWLAPLVDLLEDGEGHVREQAKETVVALLAPASTPPAARSELKKLLLARNVRKTIANDIINRVLGGGGGAGGTEGGISGRSTPAVPNLAVEEQKDAGGAGAAQARSGAATPAAGGSGIDEIEVVYIASPHDLSNEFAAMIPHFEGKETEHNWAPREKSLVRIRGMLKGGVWGKYNEAFVAGLKGGIIEGVSKTIVSLRTTVAQQSCFLLKELVEHLGSGFDQFVEHLLPILGKMAGYTKKIIADRSQACVTAMIIHTTVHPRVYITHIAAGVSDKNIQTRHFSSVHLKTFLDIHSSRSKHSIETTSGLLDQLEGSVKKSLADVNPAVRDLGRQAFWSFHAVWPQKAGVILNAMDGMARKQLDKANPHDSTGVALAASSTSKPAPPAKRASSTMSALLAEKRKAKAAELAAGRVAQESPRVVSHPTPNSPSINQGMTRSNSSASISSRPNQPGQLARSITSPEASPTKSLPDSPKPNSGLASSTKTTPRPISKPILASPRELLPHGRDRSSSLGRKSSPSRGSPSRDSPLRQSSTFSHAPSGLRSPASSSGGSGGHAHSHRTPQSRTARRGIPDFAPEHESDSLRSEMRTHEPGERTPSWEGASTPARPGAGTGIVDDAILAQAAQAESAAQQLVDYADEEPITTAALHSSTHENHASQNTPVTPARHSVLNGSGLSSGTPGMAYKTPLHVRKAWEDSPRPEAVTPLMMDRLKERKHERSWWVKRQELMEKASPLKPLTPAPSSAIVLDVEAIESSEPTMRNLQKLALFSSSNPIPAQSYEDHDEDDDGDDDAAERTREVWEEDKVFERVLAGLLRFLKPDQPQGLLEQALVLLWELVQHQWALFDGHEQELLEALFRLRASHDPTILESTNALISLLTQIADPMYFLTLIRSSLDRFLSDHPAPSPSESSNDPDHAGDAFSRLSLSSGHKESSESRIRNSGYLYGLTALGMCVLRLPEAVVEVEGRRLGEVIMDAMSSPSSIIRQSAQALLLAIQTILQSSSKTLSFVPGLSKGQKDLAIYYMAQNGILESSSTSTSSSNSNSNMGSGILSPRNGQSHGSTTTTPIGRRGQRHGDGDEDEYGIDDEHDEDEDQQRERDLEQESQLKKDKILREMEGLMGRSIARE